MGFFIYSIERKEMIMKQHIQASIRFFIGISVLVCLPWVHAETAPAETPSVGITGETQSAPVPPAMTEAPEPGVFVTLTRTALTTDQLPTNAETVTPETFRKIDAQNAGEAVSRQTSVQTLPIGRLGSIMTARIRGSSADQTLVLLDGRPVEGNALGTPDLSEIPTEQIDHIEIVRGGVSALYGPNAMGGVINIISKRATYTGLPLSHVGYESASYGRQLYRLDFGSRIGPVDYFFFGKQEWESGFRDNSDARQHNIGGNFGVSMGKAGKLLVDMGGFHSDTGTPGLACGPTDILCQNFPPQYLQPNQFNNKDEKLASSPTARQTTDDNYVRTSYLLPLPANSLATFRLFGMEREVRFSDANDPNPLNQTSTDRHEQSKGGEVQMNLPLGLVVGGNFIRDREDNTDFLAPPNTFIKSIENWGIFGQETLAYKALTLIPSGRFDHNSQVGDTSNPRVQVLADANSWLRFSGSAARSFRAPTIDDLFLVVGGAFPFNGNPNLKPETAWTYDAGFEVHPDSFSFSATYFRSNIQNLIQVKPITFDTVVNIGEARRQGAELQVSQYINNYVKHVLNYTYLENLGIPSGFTDLVSLAYSPRHTVNYMLTLTPSKPWTIDSTLRGVGSRFSGNNETGDKLGAMVLWDMRVAYQFRQLQLYIGVNDITNKRYEEQSGFPLPGRTAYGGISLRLWG
jgi:outer membrane cobalamin receptor